MGCGLSQWSWLIYDLLPPRKKNEAFPGLRSVNEHSFFFILPSPSTCQSLVIEYFDIALVEVSCAFFFAQQLEHQTHVFLILQSMASPFRNVLSNGSFKVDFKPFNLLFKPPISLCTFTWGLVLSSPGWVLSLHWHSAHCPVVTGSWNISAKDCLLEDG